MTDKYRVWVDLETTGLDVDKDSILEIGVMITDLMGEPEAIFSKIVHPASSLWEPKLDSFVRNMHTQNGLISEIKKNTGMYVEYVEADVLAFLDDFYGISPLEEKSLGPIHGSSVHFDKKFIDKYMPNLSKLFTHRIVDNSSLKELCRTLNPEVYAKLPDSDAYHRAVPDLIDSINEFKFYRDNFLFVSLEGE